MKQFTLFTLFYLADAVCLTAIALQHPDLTLHLKIILLTAAGLLYLCAGLSTFGFWRRAVSRSQARLRDRPIWRQKFAAISPWLIIVITVLGNVSLLTHVWTTEVIVRAALNLAIIVLCVENLWVRSQMRQQN